MSGRALSRDEALAGLTDGAQAPLAWVSSLVRAARAGRLPWSVLWEVLLTHLESDEHVACAAISALLEHVREPHDPAYEALRLRLMIETADQGAAGELAGAGAAAQADAARLPVATVEASAPTPTTSQLDGPARAGAKHRSDSDWFVLIEPTIR